MAFFISFLFSIIISGIVAWWVSIYGPKLNLLDVANGRSSHVGAIPTGAGFSLPVIFTCISVYYSIHYFIWIPVVLLSLFSFIGDRKDLSVKTRLLVQFICAITFCIGWSYHSGISNVFLLIFFVFFLTGTANLYNFMDGINGISGMTALIGFGFLTWYSFINGAGSSVVVTSLIVCGFSVGFLFFNFPKARVFMGDVGSIFIGFIFAVQVIVLSETLLEFLCLSSFILPFYLDEITTMTIRIKNHENITRAHRKHMYQLLANELQQSQWVVTLGFAVFQFVICFCVIWAQAFGLPAVLLVILGFSVLFTLTTYTVRKKARLTKKGV